MMRAFVIAFLVLLAGTTCIPWLPAQTELVQSHYFPADLEFVELRSIRSEKELDTPSALAELPEGAFFAEVGFKKYARRVYETSPPGGLTVEVVTLKDAKAAYSILTLLRSAQTAQGPPGDFGSFDRSNIIFSQANFLVRIQSGLPAEVSKRVALSVSNRIGRKGPEPALVKHLPQTGYDPSSLRYCLGPHSLARYAASVAGHELKFQDEVELAQVRYNLDDQTGVLSLIGFPTSQLAEEYFERLYSLVNFKGDTGQRLYFKRAGPLLGLLEGNFDPGNADAILGSIEFKYSIKWILDKYRHSSSGIWGVPGGMLGTVVRSLVFTGLLCAISIVAGVSFALFRIMLRGYAPNNFLDRPDRTEVIRLKIDEK